MFKQGKPCRRIQVATLPSAGSIPAQLVKPEHVTHTLQVVNYTESELRQVILSPNSNGAVPGLSISAGQLNLLPENYVRAYHNHVVWGHDLPEPFFPLRAGDTLITHPYAIGAYAVLAKLFIGLARAKNKSLNPEDKRAGNAYYWWYKRCEYHLKKCIQEYGTNPPNMLVLGGMVYEYAGVETYVVLYDTDAVATWVNSNLSNTVDKLVDHWVATKTQPPAVMP